MALLLGGCLIGGPNLINIIITRNLNLFAYTLEIPPGTPTQFRVFCVGGLNK